MRMQLFVACLCIIIVFGCARDKTNDSQIPVTTVSEIAFDKLSEKINEIALETKNEFFMSSSPKITAINEREEFIILDNVNQRNIYVYDKHGKALGKIGRVGQGPGEFLYPECLSYYAGKYYIYDSDLLRMSIFSGSFEFLDSFSTPLAVARMSVYNDSTFYLYRTNMFIYSADKHTAFQCNKQGHIINSFHEQSENWSEFTAAKGGGLVCVGQNIFVVNPYENKVAEYTLDGKLIRTVQGRHDLLQPAPKIKNPDIYANDMKKYLEFIKTWGVVVDIQALDDYLVVYYITPQNAGAVLYLDIYDHQLNLLFEAVKIPAKIKSVFCFHDKMYFFEQREFGNPDDLPNPHILVYQLSARQKVVADKS